MKICNVTMGRGSSRSLHQSKMRTFILSCFSLVIALFISVEGYGQTIELSGKVVDNSGYEVPGVSILIKGTGLGTISDVEGNYVLSDVASDATLVYSFIGFATQEIQVEGRSIIDVTMFEEMMGLDEIVVVGYGVQKKSDVTGSMVSVSSDELNSMPIRDAVQGIQGRAAGVDVATSDRPGTMGSILIRGNRSLSASNSPLYVVDGIPLSAGGIEVVNPHDIESIDVLKDASATAIYGARGANGVVLVTTKKGADGKVSLNVNSSVTISQLHDRASYMDAPTYIDYRRNAYRTAGQYPDAPTLADDQRIFDSAGDPTAWANIEKGWAGGSWDGSKVPTTDWGSMVTRTGITHDHTISVSGGTDLVQAYGSFGYLNQEGTNKGQDFERFSTKFGVEIQATDWFKMGGNITGTWSSQNYGFAGSGSRSADGIYQAAMGMYPHALPYTEDGDWIYLPGAYTNVVNPVEEYKNVIDERKTLRALGNLFAEIKFIDGLKYRLNFGPDFKQYRQGIYRSGSSILQGTGTGVNYARAVPTQNIAYTLDNLLLYNKTFANVHDVGVTLLQSASESRYEEYSMETNNMEWDEQKWYAFHLNDLTRKGSNYNKTSMLSYMARVNYGYDNKYLLTASARWDGASQLAEGNKWDFFPSLALAWRLDQEDFIDAYWLDQLKLRLGTGITGNSSVSAYSTQGGLAHIFYPFGSGYQSGYYASDYLVKNPPAMANKDLGWEKTAQTNFGVDFSVYRGTLSGTVDFYTSKTTDLLMHMNILPLTGYSSTFANVGETSNKGLDITLSSKNISRKDFSWRTDFTFSTNKEKIVELANGAEDDIDNLWFIGEPISVAYDYEKIGIWQIDDADEMAKFNANGHTYKAGDIKVRDVNGDYTIDANEDRVIVGQYSPKWTGGLTNTFNFKDFEFSFFMYARWGFLMNGGAADMQGLYQSRDIDYWTPNNPTNAYPVADYNNGGQPEYYSSMNYQDGSFIKMRNISLGYNIPQNLAQRWGLERAKFYVQAMDPFLIYSKTDFMDGDLRSSISTKSWVVGLNLAF